MSSRSLVRAVVRSSLVLSAVAVLNSAFAMAGGLPQALPPQSLADALDTFAKVTGMQLIYRAELAAGLSSHGAQAGLSAEQALHEILQGTGLTYVYVNDRTISIRSVGSNGRDAPVPAHAPATSLPAQSNATEAVAPGTTAGSFWSRLRLAQASDTTVANGADSLNTAAPQAPRNSESAGIPEILVAGSKILNMDIARSVDDPQPYVIFTREKIEQSGASNLEDFFKNRLTMNTTSGTLAQGPSAIAGTSSTINLRGLGANQTLILIDGHRVPDGNNGSQSTQPSIAGIPLSAVERIEVLPTTAGGIYGGSATGGVVNIILRRDYRGGEAKVAYGSAFDSGATTRRVDLSGGFTLEDGKTSVLLAGSFSNSGLLLNQDREFAERGRANILANNPAFYLSSSSPPLGATPNIRSQNGSNLVLKNGTALGSAITSVPTGYAGAATDGGAALAANAGTYNFDLSPNASVFQDSGGSTLLNGPTVKSVMATVRRQFTPAVQAFVEASASDNDGHGRGAYISAQYVIPASAPTNPFQQAITVSVPTTAADGEFESKSEDRRVVGGVIVRLPDNWRAEADYTFQRYHLAYASPAGFAASAGTAIGSGALDVLRDLTAYPADFSPYFGVQSRMPDAQTTLNDATLRLGGSAFALPGGEIQFAGLLEYRKMQFDQTVQYSGDVVSVVYPERSQEVTSLYLEARLPVFSEKNALPGLKQLELQIAGRRDEYSTDSDARRTSLTQPIVSAHSSVTASNPTFALLYRPIDDLMLRASYGKGFLPPSVDQVVSSPFNSTLTVNDPLRGGSAITTAWRNFGGSPTLEPEQSKSWSAGFVVTPHWTPGLRVSLDYSHISKTNNIYQTFDGQFFVDNEARFPDTVIRGPAPAGDPYAVGPIIAIDTLLVNIAQAEVEAFDLQLDYRLTTQRFGTFDLLALATRQTHFRTQVSPDLPVVENVGITRSNPLGFKGNAGVTWSMGGWTAGWSVRYFDSYVVSTSAVTLLNQGSPEVPSQTYHDVFLSYELPKGIGTFLEGTEISAGATNVFNKAPPFDATGFPYYSTFGDPRLGSYLISLRKSF